MKTSRERKPRKRLAVIKTHCDLLLLLFAVLTVIAVVVIAVASYVPQPAACRFRCCISVYMPLWHLLLSHLLLLQFAVVVVVVRILLSFVRCVFALWSFVRPKWHAVAEKKTKRFEAATKDLSDELDFACELRTALH